jgi:hypothetical protein
MWIPPWWWAGERFEIALGRHARHPIERDGLVHPCHPEVGLVHLRLTEAAQHLDHPADLDVLSDEDLPSDDGEIAVGVVVGEVDQAHLDGLLVVHAHVLEESDVGRVGIGDRPVVADHPADGPGEHGHGEQDGDEVDRIAVPGQQFGVGSGLRRLADGTRMGHFGFDRRAHVS